MDKRIMWSVNFNFRFLAALAVGAASFVLCYLLFYRRRRLGAVKVISLCALHIYIFAVFDLTLSDFLPYAGRIFGSDIAFDFTSALNWVSLSPFEEAVTLWRNCRQSGSMVEFYRIIGGNFALILPLGILVPLIRKKTNFSFMVCTALSVPFVIEFLQFLGNVAVGSMVRDVSLSDFLLNVLGCLFGYGIYCCISAFRRHR